MLKILRPDRPIVPSQQILLKLLDGYYQTKPPHIHAAYVNELPQLLLSLASLNIGFLETALASGAEEGTEMSPNHFIAPICEALVLVSQCIHLSLLREEGTESLRMWIQMSKARDNDGLGTVEGCLSKLLSRKPGGCVLIYQQKFCACSTSSCHE